MNGKRFAALGTAIAALLASLGWLWTMPQPLRAPGRMLTLRELDEIKGADKYKKELLSQSCDGYNQDLLYLYGGPGIPSGINYTPGDQCKAGIAQYSCITCDWGAGPNPQHQVLTTVTESQSMGWRDPHNFSCGDLYFGTCINLGDHWECQDNDGSINGDCADGVFYQVQPVDPHG